MKISSFVAIATSTALTLLSAVEAQQPLPGYTPITGPTGTPKQRMPVQVLARSYPDVYNMYMLALVRRPIFISSEMPKTTDAEQFKKKTDCNAVQA